jgi:hypothetical protein
MTIQTINLGTYRNDSTGDDLYTAFTKVNANFAELGTISGILNGANLGLGESVFAQRSDTDPTLEFKTLTSSDDSVEITASSTEIDLVTRARIENDLDPRLGADLNMNGFRIINGNGGFGTVESTVFGIDVRATNSLLEILIATDQVQLDFGTFDVPANNGAILELNGLFNNGFAGTPQVINIDFGSF